MKPQAATLMHPFHGIRLLTLGVLLAVAAAPAALANSYIGSANCAKCHADKAEALQQSIHSKMIRPNANSAGVIHGDLSKPNAPVLNDPTQLGVDWVMGGWYKEESYIRVGRQAQGDPYQYTVTQFQWDPIKQTYVNNQSLRDWTVKCAGCHTTGYQPATKTWSELNIGCEACHGPGADHAASEDPKLIVVDRTTEGCGHCHIRAENEATLDFAAKSFNFPIGYELGKPETLKFIPESLSVAASFYPDGTSNRHRQSYLDMNYPGRGPTKHYERGVSCVKCHNPHTAGTLTSYPGALPANKYGVRIFDNVGKTSSFVAWESGDNLWSPKNHASVSRKDVCKTCHSKVSDHHLHQFSPAARGADVGCVDCHMPDIINIDQTTLRGALSPHRFNSILPETSLTFGPNAQPNSCTYRCHQNTGADKTLRAQWADAVLKAAAPEIAVKQPVATDIPDGGLKSFGSVAVGSSASLTFTITNPGTLNLTGLAITVDGANAADFTVVTPPVSPVAAAASTTFTVKFTPGGGGTRNAVIHIANNDSDENPFDINLSGTGVVAPEIVVEQPAGSSLVDGSAKKSFGTVKVGKSAKKTFTIRNAGTAPLTGLKVTRFGKDLKPFIVEELEKTTLAPGASTTFKVTFEPNGTSGPRSGGISIRSNDANENPFDIKLTGEAVK